MDGNVFVDLQHLKWQSGDVYFLCSDGISGPLCDDEILYGLRREKPAEKVKALINMAINNGGEDNMTGICVCCE